MKIVDIQILAQEHGYSAAVTVLEEGQRFSETCADSNPRRAVSLAINELTDHVCGLLIDSVTVSTAASWGG